MNQQIADGMLITMKSALARDAAFSLSVSIPTELEDPFTFGL